MRELTSNEISYAVGAGGPVGAIIGGAAGAATCAGQAAVGGNPGAWSCAALIGFGMLSGATFGATSAAAAYFLPRLGFVTGMATGGGG